MSTESHVRRNLPAFLAALWLALFCGKAVAQNVAEPATWAEHQTIDALMGTLAGPTWQPVWFTEEDRPGRPGVFPIYKQQPPGAQGDFRIQEAPPTPATPPPAPSVDAEPEPEPEPETVIEPDPEPDPEPDQECSILAVIC